MRHTERVSAVIMQRERVHGGLGADFWVPLKKYRTALNAQARLVPAARPDQVENPTWRPENLLARVVPEAYTLDAALLTPEGQQET
jgi:hypothetical protein